MMMSALESYTGCSLIESSLRLTCPVIVVVCCQCLITSRRIRERGGVAHEQFLLLLSHGYCRATRVAWEIIVRPVRVPKEEPGIEPAGVRFRDIPASIALTESVRVIFVVWIDKDYSLSAVVVIDVICDL